MSRAQRRGADNAWGIAPAALAERAASHSPRLPDFVAFLLLPLEGTPVPGLQLPLNEVVIVILVVGLLLRRAPAPTHRPRWFPVLLIALLGALTLSTVLNGETAIKRLGHLAVYVLLALMLSSGRLDPRSAAKGYTAGLMATLLLGIAGFGSATYGNRLTGLVPDPNALGMLASGLGVACLAFIDRPLWRRSALVVICVGVYLTYSRTSLLAVSIALIWVAAYSRLRPLLAAGVTAVAWWFGSGLAEQFKNAGAFADRAGSDLLRQRIDIGENLVVQRNPTFGTGAGTAVVDIQGQTFYFHSSYLALRAEGGWLAIGIAGLLALAVVVALLRLPRSPEVGWLGGGLIAIGVCSMNLGEVLLVLQTAAALGLAVWWIAQQRAADAHLADHDPTRLRALARRRSGVWAHATGP